ncbi:MAG: SMC-Scp complex subunit ScpB [Candidatus Thermoplasmatota archaeon]|nr:SMC-Scp complex subunit ScpB [Candidatus Thermoplasmatota archaeon]
MCNRCKVEAILFGSSSPLTVREISGILKMDTSECSRHIRSLAKEYASGERALIVNKIGNRYRIEVKHDYAGYVYPVAEREYTQGDLRALGLIYRSGGMSITQLREKLGSKYEDIMKKLREKKMVASRRDGRATVFHVTRNFYRYFGVKDADLRQPEDGTQ